MEDQIKSAVLSYTNRKLDSMLLGPITEGEKQHIIQLAIELVLSRENIKLTNADFIKAILDNNLESAISLSDSTSIKALKFLVMIKKWCHIN
jgi:hypothetical protein